MARGALLGMEAMAIADDNTVAGIVRAHTEARKIARNVKERREFDATHGLIGPPKPAHLPDPPRAPVDVTPRLIPAVRLLFRDAAPRSEERRGGKECRSRWAPYP